MDNITFQDLRNAYLSSDVVTYVDVIDDVQPNSDALTTSEGIYNALCSLSCNIANALA